MAFVRIEKKFKKDKNFIFLNKKLNILNQKNIKNFGKYKPNIVLHLAALSRPMKLHNENIEKSIKIYYWDFKSSFRMEN